MTVAEFSEKYGFKSKYYQTVAEKGSWEQQAQYGLLYGDVMTGDLQDQEVNDRAEKLELIYLICCQG